MESKKKDEELKEISLDTINLFIRAEHEGSESEFRTTLDEDMLTIDLDEPKSRSILDKITTEGYLPELWELAIDHLDLENERIIRLFEQHRNKLDGLYLNYKVSKDYRFSKTDILPYLDSLMNIIPHVRDRLRLRWFKMNVAQMVQILKAAKHLSKYIHSHIYTYFIIDINPILIDLVDFSFWAIDFGELKDAVDFGTTKYKIKNIMFYACGKDISGGLITEENFRNILQGISNCNLASSLKRISVLELGIEMKDIQLMMEEYELAHINLTKDY